MAWGSPPLALPASPGEPAEPRGLRLDREPAAGGPGGDPGWAGLPPARGSAARRGRSGEVKGHGRQHATPLVCGVAERPAGTVPER